ncbi:hypothetical protein AIC77_000386 [Salmonella enterica subsp. enterica]|nr:hypothetical protein [Salmonella enterica subsp. enterica]EDT5581036.1 hypothetical protein [Salmonella enterica subsp. enterica serovar Choleraesuis]EDT6480951.1 hypothetical protein [Salmonella enterica subsp. enterica]HAF4749130.1 hypothetical protein [Salmonella enterica]HAF6287353.1 hypothetical protein [Salmonella enterica]
MVVSFTSIFYPLVVLGFIYLPARFYTTETKCPGILYYRFQWPLQMKKMLWLI